MPHSAYRAMTSAAFQDEHLKVGLDAKGADGVKCSQVRACRGNRYSWMMSLAGGNSY